MYSFFYYISCLVLYCILTLRFRPRMPVYLNDFGLQARWILWLWICPMDLRTETIQPLILAQVYLCRTCYSILLHCLTENHVCFFDVYSLHNFIFITFILSFYSLLLFMIYPFTRFASAFAFDYLYDLLIYFYSCHRLTYLLFMWLHTFAWLLVLDCFLF